MEMERINADTIRVLISNDDLSERGITVLDLLGNHKQIESFFYSILEEVDVDHQFQENDAVTFQVLPTRNGLELFISKNSSDLTDSIAKNLDASKNDANVSDHDQVSDFLKHKLMQTDVDRDDDQQHVEMHSDGSNGEADPSEQEVTRTVVLKLHNFEDMIDIAYLLQSDNLFSNLYKYRGDYYLTLEYYVEQVEPSAVKNFTAIALEYADKSKVTGDILSEHGKLLMEHAALEMTRKYFKQ